ncbi:uncharacterized protein TNCV_3082291 [Trichonephila clavipes]|nr:uncharacterized protein TNCV_3082291 [Trichonephila clavipes]
MRTVRDGLVIKGCGSQNVDMRMKPRPTKRPKIIAECLTARFHHIYDDNEITAENKFEYLVQATVNGSLARGVEESFPATAANYAKAAESLKAIFGRHYLLVEDYVCELLKLIISVQKQKKISMTSLYDKLESYLRAL